MDSRGGGVPGQLPKDGGPFTAHDNGQMLPGASRSVVFCSTHICSARYKQSNPETYSAMQTMLAYALLT